MDKAIQRIVSHEGRLCVLTTGGVLTVFQKPKTKEEGKYVEVLNAVKTIHLSNISYVSRYVLLKIGENEWQISSRPTDMVE